MILRDKNYMTLNLKHIISHIGSAANSLSRALTLLFLMLTLGAGSVWGQAIDYSGKYYIENVSVNKETQDNYYLCPTEGWIYYEATNTFTETDNGQPFLTTYPCKSDANYDNDKALWIIEKSGNYYTIKNVYHDKYIVYSGKISNSANDNRIRVHLEDVDTPTQDGNELFVITTNADGDIVISPKNKSGYYLNVCQGNINDLAGSTRYINKAKNDGPTTPTNHKNDIHGTIGIYNDAIDVNAPFYLEDYITRPTISYTYNSTTEKYEIDITAVQSGDITIKYTTDGTTPTASNGTTYDGTPFDPEDGVTTIKAVVIVNNEESNVATFTTPVLLGTNHKYLIQSQNNAWNSTDFHFYMIPGDEASNFTKVNTTSLFRPTMEWYFLNANEEDGVQYYYIIVNANSKNLCYDSNNGVYLDDFGDGGNKFKFKIVESVNTGSFNIIPYDLRTASGNTNRFVHKPNNGNNICNANANAISLNNADNAHSQWKFVLSSNLDKTVPFTVSDPSTDNYSYYKIASVGSNGYYIVPPSGNSTVATTSSSSDATVNWYFEEAQSATSNDWLTYYHIRNATTGEYLYFTKDANNAGACLEMRSTIDPDNADRYKFTWAKTAAATANYYIIPKLLKDVSQDQFSTLQRNGGTLQSNLNRGAGNYAWTFTTSSFTCSQPTISWSAGDGGYVVSTTESDARIYYKIGEGTLTPSTGTLYTGAISVADLGVESATIRTIAARNIDGSDQSSEFSVTVSRVATPSFTQTDDGKVELNCATDGVSYYYEMGISPSDPNTTSSTLYSAPIEGAAGKIIKTIAVKDGWINSTVATSETIEFACATPIIRKTSATTFTIECSFPTSGVTIRYTKGTNPSDPTASSGEVYSGPVTFSTSELPFTVKAIAIATDYNNSLVAEKQLTESLDQDVDGYYEISSASDFAKFIDMVNSDGASYSYKITNDITLSSLDEILESFTGELKGVVKADGSLPVISGLNHAIFRTINGGTVKNIILDDVTISGSGNKGAIANEATGASRIYNCGVLATGSSVVTDKDGYTHITTCSSEISGGGYVGGIVGLLDGSSRVINCFSYANITGGNEVGGIVGHNNVATTSANLQTMVMNCMFYGEISGGSSKAPVYNGTSISNVGADGVSNYNYFWSGANYVQNNEISVYNCALAAETRYLQRFEFFRSLLNSHLELAGWWATGSYDKSQMMKWVLEPSQIGTSTPYPILKAPAYYPSVVNIDANHAEAIDSNNEHYNEGRKLTQMGGTGANAGKLSVTIQMGTQGSAPFGKPEYAGLKSGGASTTIDLVITDKDFKHFNFNYGKVQLPYYNDYGVGNYTGNRVVTGWKITSITNGGTNSYSSGDDVTYDNEGNITAMPYNFADRNSTQKDLYSQSGRIFNQGAYWDVPEGVTAITIEPYWAKAVFVTDAYPDIVYNQDMSTAQDVPNVGGGQRYTNGSNYNFTINSETISLKVYTSITNNSGAINALSPSNSNSVYDYALVLVGNLHMTNVTNGDASKPYTIMSADFDCDNEPDYSYILRFDGRTSVHPVRVDFLNIPGLGMAQKSTGGTGTYNFGIMNPLGWFESTNTSLFRVTQFEYDHKNRVAAPYILQSGIFEQWVSGQSGGVANKTTYYHVGGNVWFKEFHRGTHIDHQELTSKHQPVSVTGGDFDEFYLTGLYRGDVANYEDNAECYINGGRFGIVAGAAMEGIGKAGGADDTGNIFWQIQNADITEFYGGGINGAHPVEGNINTIINGGYIKLFCGGPKFGDMNGGKTVKTTATGCTFDLYFGAGYGGNSYSRKAPTNKTGIEGDYGTNSWNTWLNQEYSRNYDATFKGVAVKYLTQYLPMSSNTTNVARLFIDYVSFSLATTRDVTSSLIGCTINNNFYGGGSLGKVDGPVTSTLTDCTVKGNVFGAGYSASKPTVAVVNEGNFVKAPFYNSDLGVYIDPVLPDSVDYTWEYDSNLGADEISIDTENHILKTPINLSETNLGSVSGAVSLTITTTSGGSSVIGTANDNNTGHVYGGGDESTVYNTVTPANASTTVTLSGNTEILGNVFGGGNQGDVSGSTQVIIE